MAKMTRKTPPVVMEPPPPPPPIPEPEPQFDIRQACNEFCLQTTTRTHALKRYAAETHTAVEWGEIFRRDRVI